MRTRIAAAALAGISVLILGGTMPVRACLSMPPVRAARPPVVQLAILLDTSNSMDGLIGQAKTQLWKITNEFARARRDGKPAELQVALYEYGNSRLTPASGWVRRVLPFTSDLDRVSEALFALTTSGGDEFCGTVLQTALDELAWSKGPGDMRVIFIAGNEPFTQGPVDYRKVCARARNRGITVNTIHCGTQEDGEATGWRDGALIASGAFSTMDQNQRIVHIDAPQDAQIARLGEELNKTYVPYGLKGKEGQSRQEAQDKNSKDVGHGSAVQRSMTKANRYYSNAGWDLVDAVAQGQADLDKLKTEELPQELQSRSVPERKDFVAAKKKDRDRLQSEINTLRVAREKYVAETTRTQKTTVQTVDVAVIAALREQARKQGIELE